MFDWRPVYVLIGTLIYCFAIVFAGITSLSTNDVQNTVSANKTTTQDGSDTDGQSDTRD